MDPSEASNAIHGAVVTGLVASGGELSEHRVKVADSEVDHVLTLGMEVVAVLGERGEDCRPLFVDPWRIGRALLWIYSRLTIR